MTLTWRWCPVCDVYWQAKGTPRACWICETPGQPIRKPAFMPVIGSHLDLHTPQEGP